MSNIPQGFLPQGESGRSACLPAPEKVAGKPIRKTLARLKACLSDQKQAALWCELEVETRSLYPTKKQPFPITVSVAPLLHGNTMAD